MGMKKCCCSFQIFVFFIALVHQKVSTEKLDLKGLCNSIFKGIKKSDSTKKTFYNDKVDGSFSSTFVSRRM